MRTAATRQHPQDTHAPSDPDTAPYDGAYSDQLLLLIAQRMRIIGEPSRMRILLFLEQRDASVQEVADELMLPQQSASHHLTVLYRAGVLSRTAYGTSARFALADYTALRMIEQGRASLTGYAEELSQIACPQ